MNLPPKVTDRAFDRLSQINAGKDPVPLRIAVLALLAAAVFGATALISAALTVRGARGSTLRETAR